MMRKTLLTSPSWPLRLFRPALVVAVVLGLFVLIGLMARDIYHRLAELGQSDSENGQWVMTQTEVELLRLQSAISIAYLHPKELADVRRWFDVSYSRAALLRQSPLYDAFFSEPRNNAALKSIEAYLAKWEPLIDGEDGPLSAALPQLFDEATALQPQARALALQALEAFSTISDRTRAQISEALASLAAAIAVTILFLALLAATSWGLYNRSRKQAQALEVAGQRLRVIINTSPDAVIVADQAGRVIEFNPAAEAILGHDRADVLHKRVLTLLSPPGQQDQTSILLHSMAEKSTTQGAQLFEYVAQRADGSLFPAEIAIAKSDPLPEAQAAADGDDDVLVVSFLRDISSRKAAQADIEDALTRARAGEKAKAEFLAVMSHEMRTPLNGLLGAMELLVDTPLGEDQRELLQVMQVSGAILLGHANAVLDLSSIEAGGLKLARLDFDLDRLIAECIANQAGLAQSGGNQLRHLALDGPLGAVTGDPGRLQQILLNLIGNAVKFTRNGAITVETERLPPARGAGREGMVEFRVIDTGIGIAEEDLHRIFRDFETIDSSYGRKSEGTGLGLGIARRLALAMGGDIGVESELGEGSLFWLRLPLPAATLPQRSAPLLKDQSLPESGSSGLNILIIEDNDINRYLLRRYLDGAGHTVVEAADGREGWSAARKTRFDLVITDISMPGMDGIETTRRIRADSASVQARILALTAHALPGDFERFTQAGIDGYLTKPISRAKLLAEVEGGALPSAGGDQSNFDTTLNELSQILGEAPLSGLLERMIEEGDALVLMLHQDVKASDAAMLVHRFAGSCGTFGAVPLQRKLAALETALHHENTAEITQLTDMITPLWETKKAILKRYCGAM